MHEHCRVCSEARQRCAEACNGLLQALPADDRYTLASELYAGSGERIIEKLASPRQTAELAAIGAAVESMQERELLEITAGVGADEGNRE